MSNNKQSITSDDTRDRRYSESGLVVGLFVEPIKFELMQKEVRRSMNLSKALENVIQMLDDKPAILLREFETKKKLGQALSMVLFDELKDVEKKLTELRDDRAAQ